MTIACESKRILRFRPCTGVIHDNALLLPDDKSDLLHRSYPLLKGLTPTGITRKVTLKTSLLFIVGLIISQGENYYIMPDLIKRKCHNPDAYLDEQDLRDIAEAEEDIRQGRVHTTKEAKAILGIQ